MNKSNRTVLIAVVALTGTVLLSVFGCCLIAAVVAPSEGPSDVEVAAAPAPEAIEPPVPAHAQAHPGTAPWEIPDTEAWSTSSLPRADLGIRHPSTVRIVESGRIVGNTPQAGPYIGLSLPSGRDVQVDALVRDIGETTARAREQAAEGVVTIVHTSEDAVVTQPTGRDDACTVTVCHAVGEHTLCGDAGSLRMVGQTEAEATYPTLHDCGVLIAAVRSIRAL